MQHKSADTKPIHTFWRYVGRFFAALGITLLALLIAVVGFCYVVLKGPSPTVRDMFVNTMLETSALKFVPSLFLSREEIDAITNKNAVIETDESTDANVEFTEKQDDVSPDTIEVIDIQSDSFSGKLMLVHDPSRVRLATLSSFGGGTKGKTLLGFVEEYGAVAAINGGGFADENGLGSGGVPLGVVIHDGQLVYGGKNETSSLVAFDNENHLVVGRMTAQQALDRGVRDAVSFGPAFIVNGTPAEVSGTGSGVNPRTVIGQRADGTVLLLVIDGRQAHSLGATYKDCIEVMLKYGAVNAANLDGGMSTAMVYNNEIINSCASLNGLRYIPTAYVVI